MRKVMQALEISMRRKRMLCLVLCAMCAVGLLSCKEQRREESRMTPTVTLPAEVTKAPTVTESAPAGYGYRSITQKVLEERYPGKTILVWMYNSVLQITPDVNIAINDILQEEGKDYVLWFQREEEDRYEGTINKNIEDGQAPDLICAGVGTAGTLQGSYRAVTNGWLLDLEDYFASPEGQALWNAVPEGVWKACKVNGHYYGISTKLPFTTDYAYYVNAALLEQYGITEEDLSGKTVTELTEVFEKISGEEKCDVLRLRQETSYALAMDGYSCMVETFGIQSDALAVYNQSPAGEFVNLFSEERAAEWFRAIADYRKAGYLPGDTSGDTFFLAVGWENRLDQTVAERQIAALRELYPQVEEILVIPYLPAPLVTQFNSITGVCRYSAQPELALQALTETMTNPEITDLLLYGIEDTDYTVTDGKIEPADIFAWVYSMYFGNTLLSTPTAAEPENKEEALTQVLSEMTRSPQLGVYIDLTGYKAQVAAIQTIVSEYRGLLSGEYEDVDAALQDLNERLAEAGIEEVLEAANAQLQNTKNSNR